MSELEDDDLTACINQFVNTPFRERLKESIFYCDGDKVRLFQEQPAEDFALVFIEKLPSGVPGWWDAALQNRMSRRIQGQWPLLSALFANPEYRDSFSRFLLQAVLVAESHRVLKASGYVVVQSDPAEVQIWRLILDQVYGFKNVVNNLAWHRNYNAPSVVVTRFATVHDDFAIYRKTDQAVFRQQRVPCLAGYVQSQFKYTDAPELEDEDAADDDAADDDVSAASKLHERANATGRARAYRLQSPTGSTWGSVDSHDGVQLNGGRKLAPLLKEIPPDQIGGTTDNLDYLIRKGIVVKNSKGTFSQKQYADNTVDMGEPMSDLWMKIPYSEGMLHPTNKHPTANEQCIDGDVGSLEGAVARLLESLTQEGDKVLLPFCTRVQTVAAAVWKKRSWVAFGPSIKSLTDLESRIDQPEFEGIRRVYNPTTYKEALALRDIDPRRMECQRISLAALGKALGIGSDHMASIKRGPDGGVDGTLTVFTVGGEQAVNVICSVKSNAHTVDHVRQLHSVIAQRGCQIGLLLIWGEPTGPMKKEVQTINRSYPPNLGLQIVELKKLLQGHVVFNFLKAGVELRGTPTP